MESYFLEGEHISPWIDTTPSTNYPSLQEDIKTDVAIVGGGIAGLTCAILLAEKGMSATVIESGKIIEGATGFTTAKITSLHDIIYDYLINTFGFEKAKMYADANQTAIEKIKELSEKYNIDCDFQRIKAFTYSLNENDKEKFQKEVKAAKKLDLPAFYTEQTPLPYGVKTAVYFENQAFFHPRKYLLGIAQKFIEKKGKIFENTKALNIEEEENFCKIITNKGVINAKHAVIATHFPFFDRNKYFAKLAPYRSYALGVHLKKDIPEGMLIGLDQYSIRPLPLENLELMILGGADHKVGQIKDTKERYLNLKDFANKNFSWNKIYYHWSTQDNYTPDNVPYIGKDTKDSKRVFIATGFNGWGMTNGTVSGMILSDEILGINNPWKEVFDPSRLKISSAKNILKENINSFSHLIRGKIEKPAIKDVSALSLDDGEVINFKGKKIAVYRDEKGNISSISAVCTHMGCIVKFNNAEKSWDCPCHGSRFDVKGKVIQTPAVKDLKNEEIS